LKGVARLRAYQKMPKWPLEQSLGITTWRSD
jgi:hypothetical protein